MLTFANFFAVAIHLGWRPAEVVSPPSCEELQQIIYRDAEAPELPPEVTDPVELGFWLLPLFFLPTPGTYKLRPRPAQEQGSYG